MPDPAIQCLETCIKITIHARGPGIMMWSGAGFSANLIIASLVLRDYESNRGIGR